MTIQLNEHDLRALFRKIFRLNLWDYKIGLYVNRPNDWSSIRFYLFDHSQEFENMNLYYIFPQLGAGNGSKKQIKPIFEVIRNDKTFILTTIK